MNIAVLDDGGGLLYFRRDPASFRGSVDISINKAWTATQFGFPTRLFGESIVKAADGIQYTPRLIIFPVGCPSRPEKCSSGGSAAAERPGNRTRGGPRAGWAAAKGS